VIDVITLLKKSSNIGAARLALMLGNRRMEAYLRAFGFGDSLGIDLPGEERGILHPSRRWSQLSPTRIAIGQGVAVTALQMLNAYCAIANQGQLMWPHVVSRIEAPSGERLYEATPRVLARPIRPEIAAEIRKMLVGVTEEGGTARRAAVAQYSVAGKTGTAQIPMHGGYSDKDYWASFVGFCPAEKPEFGVIVVVERPTPQHTGGFVAAPAFGRIAEAVAHYLEIPSDLPGSGNGDALAGDGSAPRSYPASIGEPLARR
jgi:cell division protein FtsI/penicillin-binding protein 2